MINQAIELAKNLTNRKYRLVAIITDKRNRILSIGFNSYQKTHPKQAFFSQKYGNGQKIYLHAEISAILKCKHKPSKIFIARVNKKGEARLAKPCSICEQVIKQLNIKKIYHT